MTGRPFVDDFEDFALILFRPAVHHSCLSVEPEPELLEVTEVLTEGVPDVRSRAFRSFRCPTLSPTCHDRSAANIVNRSSWGMCWVGHRLDSTSSGGERANKYHKL